MNPACQLLVLVFVLVGCQPATEDPADLSRQFQAALDELRQEYEFPGATAAYVLAGGQSGVVATGLADVESDVPMQPSTRMLAASIGKTFVAATVLGLVQEGKLEFDDPASVWLGEQPWFNRLPNYQSMTVWHLLTHRAGLPNHVDTPEFAEAFAAGWDKPGTLFTPEQLVDFILDEPPLFAAGSGWSYTDTGYILLGLIVEAASGQSYYAEIERRFIAPLQLEHTSPSDRRELSGLAAGYMSANNPFGLPTKTLRDDGHMAWNPAIEWTGGGVVSNSYDLAVWAKALFEGRAMDGAYLDDLLNGEPISDEAPGLRFGAGIAMRDSGVLGPWYSHGGWIPGYSSSFRYYPEHRTAIVFQINTDIGIVDDSTDLYDAMATRLEEIVAEHTAE